MTRYTDRPLVSDPRHSVFSRVPDRLLYRAIAIIDLWFVPTILIALVVFEAVFFVTSGWTP